MDFDEIKSQVWKRDVIIKAKFLKSTKMLLFEFWWSFYGGAYQLCLYIR